MLVGAMCDACRRGIGTNATNLQVVMGEVISTGSGVSLRSTRSPESYNLCSDCVAPVYQLLHEVVRGEPVRMRA